MSTQLTILVVDDEPHVANAVAYMLKGECVRLAFTGEQAIDACRQEAFDLILCDLSMPGMPGTDVYEALRALGTGVHERLVFMTGWMVEASDFDTKGRPVLTKPFGLRELAPVLEKLRSVQIA